MKFFSVQIFWDAMRKCRRGIVWKKDMEKYPQYYRRKI